MNERNIISAVLLGTLLCVGLATMGLLLSEGIIKFRDMERVVSVKGLSERDMPADVAIWPIRFSEVSNDLSELYGSLESKNDKVNNFLRQQGFKVMRSRSRCPPFRIARPRVSRKSRCAMAAMREPPR